MAKILKVTHYGDSPEENKEVTISPVVVKMVFADVAPSFKQNRSVKNISLLLMEGDTVELCISESELYTLEEVVGLYDFED